MSLQHHLADIGITGGLDVKSSPHKVEPPNTTTCDNAVFTLNGALRKRNGWTQLSPTVGASSLVPTTQSSALAVVNGELCYADGLNFYVYSSLTSSWNNRGNDSPVAVSAYPAVSLPAVSALGTIFGNAVFADFGNYRCVAYDPSPSPLGSNSAASQLWVGIWDKSKNGWHTPPIQELTTTGAGAPQVVTFGNFFYVFFRAQNGIYYYIIDATALAGGFAYGSRNSLFTSNDLYDGPSFVDAAVNSTRLYVLAGAGTANGGVATTGIGGGLSASLRCCTTAGGTAFNSVVSSPFTGRQTITANDRYVLITSSVTSAVSVVDTVVHTASASVGTGIPANFETLVVGAFGTNGTTCNAIVATNSGQSGGAQLTAWVIGTVVSPRTISFTTTQAYPWQNHPCGCYPLSKPIYNAVDANFYIWTTSLGQVSAILQPTIQLQNLTGSRVIARAAYDVAGVVQSIPQVNQGPNTTLPYSAQGTFDTFALSANALTFFALPTTSTKVIVPLARGAFITGAQPYYYDGVVTRTSGYNGFPELTTSITGTTGGSLTVNTPYQYALMYRSFDNYGNFLYSAAGPFQTYTTGASERGIVIAPISSSIGWPVYNQADTGTVAGTFSSYVGTILYRNTAAAPTSFYEVTAFPPALTSPSTVFVDTTSDASLASSAAGSALPFLYSSLAGGNELNNDPPPACSVAVATSQRLFLISSENPTRLYYSKPFNQQSPRPVEFNTNSFILVDPPTGAMVALAVMDGNIIAFKGGSIYQISGTGPDATGSGAFNPILKIASNDGCTNPKSVVVTAMGTFFQSARGLQLLTRELTTQYIGAPVEPLFQNNNITAALLVAKVSQVRFFLDNGTVVVFDYLVNKWSTFSSRAGNVAGYWATAATVWNGNQVVVDYQNSTFNQESTGFLDAAGTAGSTAIAMTIETPWIVYQQPQSWNRLRRVILLGDYKTANTATLQFAYDWQSSYIDTVAFTTSVGLVGGDSVYQWIARAPRQVMQAVRLKLADSNTTGESYDLTNLGLEYAVRGPVAKLPQQKSV